MDDEEIYFTQTAPLKFERTDDGKLIVSGWSVHTGLFQGDTVEIPASELRNIAESLNGKQLRKNHSHLTEDVVGRVTETRVGLDKNIRKKGVRFKGVVRDSELEQKIEDGFIDNNSIGFHLYPKCSVCGEDFRECRHWFDEAHVIAQDCSCYEQSFVSAGADGDTTIEPGASFSTDENTFMAQFDKEKKLEGGFVKKPEKGSDSPTINIPSINVVLNYEDGEFKETKNGEKMEKEVELQAQIVKLQADVQAAESAKATAMQEKAQAETELASVKEELETTKSELSDAIASKETAETKLDATEAELKDVKEEVDAYKTAEAEKAFKAKEDLCKSIAQLRVDKGMLEEKDFDAKVEELMKIEDTKALEEIKFILDETKIEKGEDGKIGEFANQKTGDHVVEQEGEETEFDLTKMSEADRNAVIKEMYGMPQKK